MDLIEVKNCFGMQELAHWLPGRRFVGELKWQNCGRTIRARCPTPLSEEKLKSHPTSNQRLECQDTLKDRFVFTASEGIGDFGLRCVRNEEKICVNSERFSTRFHRYRPRSLSSKGGLLRRKGGCRELSPAEMLTDETTIYCDHTLNYFRCIELSG